MGELRLAGLDEAVLAQLSRRAEAHGRSEEEEAKLLLAVALAAGQDPSTLETLAEARRQTAATVRSDTLALLREGRDELA